MFKISTKIKKVVAHIRTSVKLILLILLSLFIIMGLVTLFYRPMYRVTLKGETIGYTENREELQKRISDYINHGDTSIANAAFAQIKESPNFSMCLLKKGIVTNDEEIYQKVIEGSTMYYHFYAVTENGEEKHYTSTFEEAEQAVNELKEKNSTNKENLAIAEKYAKELKTLDTKDTIVSKLYVEPVKVTQTVRTSSRGSSYTATSSSGTVNTATTISRGSTSLGISLIRPVSGIITSRFAENSSVRSSSHTGLDIATSRGTAVAAAASGTVTFSGWKGSYGKLIVITHSNGVQTYYGHCDALYASVGQTVSQGQTICAVGSTGNSTGPHLHFEVYQNGKRVNPLQFYSGLPFTYPYR